MSRSYLIANTLLLGGGLIALSSCATQTPTAGESESALIQAPSPCSPLDPSCTQALNYPIDTEAPIAGLSNAQWLGSGPTGWTLPSMIMGVVPGDADADGFPDAVDDCPLDPDFRAACGDATDDGYYFELPYLGAIQTAAPNVTATPEAPPVDIYFLIDRSDTMQPAIANLAMNLTMGTLVAGCPGGIIGAIQCEFPDARFGVGVFGDYPDEANGIGRYYNLPYQHLLDLTTDTVAVGLVLNNLTTADNITSAESLTQALYATVTGEGLGDSVAPRVPCAGGQFGYACFDPARDPYIFTFTDEEMHNGPPHDASPFPPMPRNDYTGTFSQASTAMVPNRPISPYADTFMTADMVSVAAGTSVAVIGDLGTFTNQAGSGCGGDTADAFIQFTGPAGVTLNINTENSSYDSVLDIFTGALAQQACDDDDGVGRNPYDSSVAGIYSGVHYAVIDGDDVPAAPPMYPPPSEGLFRVVFNPGGPTVMTAAAPVSYANVIAAMTGANAKVLAVTACGVAVNCGEVIEDAEQLGIGTGSVDGVGAPYVESVAADGSNLSAGLVAGVQAIANTTRYNLELIARDNTGTAGIDERDFVDSITLVTCPGATCNPGAAGTLCGGCLGGTNVDFQINLQNDIVMPTTVEQVFDFTLDIEQDGVVTRSIPVRVLVPAQVTIYTGPTYYEVTYDATTRCDIPPNLPYWFDFDWDLNTPAGTSVDFEIWTADSVAALAAAGSVKLSVPGDIGPRDLSGADFLAASLRPDLAFVRVRATLNEAPGGQDSPILRGFEIKWGCGPEE